METEIIVALIAFAGSALGTFTGIVEEQIKVANHRIRDLEEERKVEE